MNHPNDWPAPRGHRTIDLPGSNPTWSSTLSARRAATFVSPAERACVETLRTLISVLVEARHDQGLTVRDAARAAGVPMSVLCSLESGSAWPRLETLQAVARVYGLIVTLEGSDDPFDAVLGALAGSRISELASATGLQRQTLYNLRLPGRPLSMKTLLLLTSTSGQAWEVRRERPRGVMLATA